MRMPPLIVYRLNSSTMNGMYSCTTTCAQRLGGQAQLPRGCRNARYSSVTSASIGGHVKLVEILFPPVGRLQQRQHGDRAQQQRKRMTAQKCSALASDVSHLRLRCSAGDWRHQRPADAAVATP